MFEIAREFVYVTRAVFCLLFMLFCAAFRLVLALRILIHFDEWCGWRVLAPFNVVFCVATPFCGLSNVSGLLT